MAQVFGFLWLAAGDSPSRADAMSVMAVMIAGWLIRRSAGHGKKTGAGLPEGFHQCAIIKFTHQARCQALVIQPAIDVTADRGMYAGQEQRRVVEAFRNDKLVRA